MVTHDPSAASYADRVIFLADGHVVEEMADPTTEAVLDRMKSFDSHGRHASTDTVEPTKTLVGGDA